MHRNDRYVPGSDGTPIAWHIEGSGPAIVFVNGFSTSNFFWRYLYPELKGRATLITWDYKGHGDSAPARTLEGCSIEAMVDDLRRVMDAAGVEQATLLGFSMGCQVVYEAWRHIPDRLSGLVPILGPAGNVLENLLRPFVGPLIHRTFHAISEKGLVSALGVVRVLMGLPVHYELGRVLGLVGKGAPRKDIKRYIDHFGRVHPETIRRIALAAQDHNAEDLLPTIDVPSLVVVGGKDTFSPPRMGLAAQSRIPGGELLYLPTAGHTGLFEMPETLNPGVIGFLETHGLVEA